MPEFAVFQVYQRISFISSDIFAFIADVLPEHFIVYAVIYHFFPLSEALFGCIVLFFNSIIQPQAYIFKAYFTILYAYYTILL